MPGAQADPVSVRYVQGAFHGFLELRSEDGHVVAFGDSTSVVHGDRITAETLFRFKDGSVDDEIAVFSQHRNFLLISDHHIQKGPACPHPMDVMIDARSGNVTVRAPGKDGKEEVQTDQSQPAAGPGEWDRSAGDREHPEGCAGDQRLHGGDGT
jgi:hypothetical protein